MLGRRALVASRQTSDESFLREALTHFSQFNEKHQKTCPAWKLHNNKSQPRRKYCIQPRCTNPTEFGWVLLSLLDCQSCVFLPSCCYHFDLAPNSNLFVINSYLWKLFQIMRELSNRDKNTSLRFNIAIYASLFRFKWSLDGWGKIFCLHQF